MSKVGAWLGITPAPPESRDAGKNNNFSKRAG